MLKRVPSSSGTDRMQGGIAMPIIDFSPLAYITSPTILHRVCEHGFPKVSGSECMKERLSRIMSAIIVDIAYHVMTKFKWDAQTFGCWLQLSQIFLSWSIYTIEKFVFVDNIFVFHYQVRFVLPGVARQSSI